MFKRTANVCIKINPVRNSTYAISSKFASAKLYILGRLKWSEKKADFHWARRKALQNLSVGSVCLHFFHSTYIPSEIAESQNQIRIANQNRLYGAYWKIAGFFNLFIYIPYLPTLSQISHCSISMKKGCGSCLLICSICSRDQNIRNDSVFFYNTSNWKYSLHLFHTKCKDAQLDLFLFTCDLGMSSCAKPLNR